jgi:hypothetical protein
MEGVANHGQGNGGNCPICAGGQLSPPARILLESFVRILKETTKAIERYLASTKSTR